MLNAPHTTSCQDVAYQLSLIHTKIDQIAERSGVLEQDRLSLKSTLGALPLASRRHLGLVLQGLRTFTENDALVSAVQVVTSLAAGVWENRVRGVTDEAEAAHFERRRLAIQHH